MHQISHTERLFYFCRSDFKQLIRRTFQNGTQLFHSLKMDRACSIFHQLAQILIINISLLVQPVFGAPSFLQQFFDTDMNHCLFLPLYDYSPARIL